MSIACVRFLRDLLALLSLACVDTFSPMASSVEEYNELFNQEVGADVVSKLKELAVHGVPDELRVDVWRLLLLGAGADDDDTRERYDALHKELPENMKRLRGEVKRYNMSKKMSDSSTRRLERVVSAFVNHTHTAYSPTLVHLCGPLALVFSDERELFCALERVVHRIRACERLAGVSVSKTAGAFLTMFRSYLPDLYNHFEEEEMGPGDWLIPWLESLLSAQLPTEALLRLWDAYFASDSWFALHLFVCLAVLRHLKDDLEELEDGELKAALQRLPSLDMDQILAHAVNVRDELEVLDLV